MIFVALLFFVCLVAFFIDVYGSWDGIVFPGWVSAAGFFGMCLLGATLAISRL